VADRAHNGSSIPTLPDYIESEDGEYFVVRAESAEQAVKRGCLWEGRPADDHGYDPVLVELIPVAGVPGCEVWWGEDLSLARELAEDAAIDDPDSWSGEVTLLGSPVPYWRLRDGC
jgi:hypothetical protein